MYPSIPRVSTQTPEQIFSFINLFFCPAFFVEAGKRKRKKKRPALAATVARLGVEGVCPRLYAFLQPALFFRFDDVWGPFPPDWHISSRAGVPGRPNLSNNPYNTYVLIKSHDQKAAALHIHIYMYVHIRTYISLHIHTYITN